MVTNNIVGHLSYFNKEGELEVIFNTSSTYIKEDHYSPKTVEIPTLLKVNGKTKPVKAIINLETGDMETHAINFDSSITSFSYASAREKEVIGVYKIMHNKGKDTYISTVDFKKK